MSKELAMAAATGTVSPVEGTNVETPPVAPPPNLDSERLARFARKEMAARQREEAIKLRETEFAQKNERAEAILKKAQDFETTKATNPVQALRDLGFSETDIFNFMAEGEKVITPEERAAAAAQAEIKKFHEEQSLKEKAQEQTRNNEIIKRYESTILKTIESDKAAYKYSNYAGAEVAQELAFSYAKEVLAKEGEMISAKEASDAIEAYYKDFFTGVKALDEPAAPAPAPEPVAPKSKTLTSKVTPTLTSMVQKRESRAEKRERLENALRNIGKV